MCGNRRSDELGSAGLVESAFWGLVFADARFFFLRIGTGNFVTTSPIPSPTACITPPAMTSTAFTRQRESDDISQHCPSRPAVRLRDMAGFALAEKMRVTLLPSR